MRHHDHEGGGGRGEDLESVDSTMERERALRRIIVVRVRCARGTPSLMGRCLIFISI